MRLLADKDAQPEVTRVQTPLSRLISAALPAGWTANRVSREAQDLGYTLSPTTVLSYLNGTHADRPSSAVLSAIAAVLKLDVEALQAAAAAPRPASRYEPPAQIHQLNTRAQAAVDELIRLLANAGQTAPDLLTHSVSQASAEEVDAANVITNQLLSAAQTARHDLKDTGLADHLAALANQLAVSYGRADLAAVEVSLPSAPSPAARTRRASRRHA